MTQTSFPISVILCYALDHIALYFIFLSILLQQLYILPYQLFLRDLHFESKLIVDFLFACFTLAFAAMCLACLLAECLIDEV